MADDTRNQAPRDEALESAIKTISELQESVRQLEAWKASKEAQQLQYPLDFVSQQIIQGFVSVSGASYMPLGGTPGFGIYYGDGSPNTVVPAGKGSLFLNYTGSSTSTRAYINTDGATAWTAVTTAT